MSETRQHVLVLDDDATVLTSLERLLVANGYAVRTHSTPETFFASGPPAGVACLLLDQNLGPVKGTDVHAEMHRRGWALPTVFITADWNRETVVQVMRTGADDFLIKPYDPEELLQIVNRCLAHSRASLQTNQTRARLCARAATLTPRERTIVTHVVSGMLNKQIADRLGLALVTVKVHRARAMQKLGAKTAAELARLVGQIGLADEPNQRIRT
jgi:FixJ family two-component response regulator